MEKGVFVKTLIISFALNCCLCDRISPNFVYILTDDQDLMLNGLMSMKKSLSLIADRGKFFLNAFVNTPLCCPSRSTILTGKFAHNLGVVNNSVSGNCNSEQWQINHEPYSIAALLQSHANYTTFYAGKYLNQYGSKFSGGTSHVPKGYDWWIGLKGNSKYYNYTLSVNGTAVKIHNLYLTDLLKHWIVQMPPVSLPKNITILDNIQRRRLQTLLAVDDLVERVVLQLKKLKLFHKTYFIINSDNGYHIGQFGQPWDKRQPYEADTRVPLLISGPGVPKRILEPYPVSSVDIAPTILHLAGIKTDQIMDGNSFKKQLFNKRNVVTLKYIFLEYWGEGEDKMAERGCPWKYDSNVTGCTISSWCKCQDSRNNTYTCVIDFRGELRFKFCRFLDNQNFVEAYNLSSDPYELRNVYTYLDIDLIKFYHNILNNFEHCVGKSCKAL
ncbi:N-acetylglucosamine-6-sulfatase-like isoform X2 [Rhynchophorus ferrugineus]|uniref:N-acetylglucosamine-6-sulfatase-like isoform X2 n=1 Tax=Rhynchophorus ferrugineus TaxID=354439 RepID=UPI003FCD5C23